MDETSRSLKRIEDTPDSFSFDDYNESRISDIYHQSGEGSRVSSQYISEVIRQDQSNMAHNLDAEEARRENRVNELVMDIGSEIREDLQRTLLPAGQQELLRAVIEHKANLGWRDAEDQESHERESKYVKQKVYQTLLAPNKKGKYWKMNQNNFFGWQ